MPKKRTESIIIQVDTNYRFTVDETNYTLESKQINSKTNEYFWKTEGFYTNIMVALKKIVHLEVINQINSDHDGEISIQEYFKLWQSQLHKFENKLSNTNIITH